MDIRRQNPVTGGRLPQ